MELFRFLFVTSHARAHISTFRTWDEFFCLVVRESDLSRELRAKGLGVIGSGCIEVFIRLRLISIIL